MKSNLNQNLEKIENENIFNDKSKEDENIEEEFNELNSIENNKIADEISNSINTENQKEETNDEPIYVMTLALEQGKSEKIEIYANSDPAELAYDFCNKNNLDFNALDYLKEQITNLLESYAKNENNENEENDNIEENNTENINVPEIEEIQEDQEFNITENTKSQKTETNGRRFKKTTIRR